MASYKKHSGTKLDQLQPTFLEISSFSCLCYFYKRPLAAILIGIFLFNFENLNFAFIKGLQKKQKEKTLSKSIYILYRKSEMNKEITPKTKLNKTIPLAGTMKVNL